MAGEATTRHVVAMPYPGRGHINPMMNLCRLISSRMDRRQRLLITFVVTEEWLGFISSYDKPSNVRFATIPNVVPSELVRADDMPRFVSAVYTEMEEPFDRLLDRLEPAPIELILTDTFLSWAVEVGNRRSIPVASMWSMPASVFSIFYNFDLLVQHRHFPVELSERGEERVDYIPGISSIRLADLPGIIHLKDKRLLDLVLRCFSSVSKAQYILFTSTLVLESQVIDALKQQFSVPLLCLGPLIPHMNLDSDASYNGQNDRAQYMEWLDSQPRSSVLYVSLGSFLCISNDNMDEVAAGLPDSGVRYLWVARREASRLRDDCGRGVVVPWCDQLKVLCHPSVGGFWTHCGWNSTMEGIYAGVPMLALPIAMDQFPISKFMIEEWKNGIGVRREIGGEGIMTKEAIAKLVRRFMDLESPEREELTKNARELQRACREAVGEGGSSDRNLDYFIKSLAIID